MAFKSAVIGHTTQTTSRILAVFERPKGRARLAFADDNGVRTLDVPINSAPPFGLATFELSGLSGERVRYGIVEHDAGDPLPTPADNLSINGSAFRTVTNGPIRIGLVSCNDIDNHEFPKERRGAMWRALKALVDEGKVNLLVHAGDQIYGDGDPTGWSPSEGRTAAYRRHYVQTWSHPDVAAVLGSCPNVMMWDDHEIYDGWGSNNNDGSPQAVERYRAAEQAFKEFQVALSPRDRLSSAGFGWIAKHGDVAILAVDGRSQRSWRNGAILGKQQLDDLELRLNELAALDLRHLFVVVGTPVVYLPLAAAEALTNTFNMSSVDDIRDGWAASNNQNECRRFLMSLMNFAGFSPRTQVTLMGGDIHVGTMAHIDTVLGFGQPRSRPRLYQVTASGIARPAPRGMARIILSLLTNGGSQNLFNGDIKGFLREIAGSDHRYCVTHRNFAILDPSDGADDWDRNNNLVVRFHVERDNGAIGVLEQVLPRVHT
ncbi:alkaline phosphatase D family protein [Sorangium sp. So ce204]|uniref:alkaline phosphatase D family protein n=1 Tax=Sorangium sp. So ce204 TaxID=3133288 RepID=UPI003F61C72A